MQIPHIPSAVARKLGHYVYIYTDPRDNTPFYIGKGKNGRVLSHMRANDKRAIRKRIRAILAEGHQPEIEVLAHGLRDNETALRVEAAAIDLVGKDKLVNAVRGHGCKQGRMPLGEAVAHYTRRKVNIREPAILIRINQLYEASMSPIELYDATRSAWKVGERRRNLAEYAFAVFEGVVREVYQIEKWLPAGSTFNSRWNGERTKRHSREGRWEFVGTLAPEKLRKRYVNRFVGHLTTQGAQNPISYVNVE